MNGVFLSFEGGDRAGKTTQVDLLAAWLGERGIEVVVTREPGGTPTGQDLRQLLLHGRDIDARTEALLFAADRAQHVAELIRPSLARGAVVITDRYLDSSVAYQGGGRDLSATQIEELSLWAVDGLLPALTVLLDLDDDGFLARARAEGEDRMESTGIEFHRRTRRAFLDRAKVDADRWLVADAAQPREVVAAQIQKAVTPLLVQAGLPVPPAREGAS